MIALDTYVAIAIKITRVFAVEALDVRLTCRAGFDLEGEVFSRRGAWVAMLMFLGVVCCRGQWVVK